MKIGSTLIVGAGGIGSHLAEPLARLLLYHDDGEQHMTIVDGDSYEEKNSQRQMFPWDAMGRNKAAVLADRVNEAADLTNADAVEGYINSDVDAAGLMMKRYKGIGDSALLVVLAVDNDATRRLFYDGIEQLPKDHPDIVIIDAGNDLETATVSTSFWKERKSRLVSPVQKYENLRNPKDRVPGGGCMAQAPSTPQLMVANMSAALMVMLVVQALLDGKQFTDDVQANVRTFSVGVAGGLYGG